MAELVPRYAVRVASGLREAVDQLVRRVPDAIVCKQDLLPYRGDVFLSLVAREHPLVRRILCADGDDVLDVAHVTLPAKATASDIALAIDYDATA